MKQKIGIIYSSIDGQTLNICKKLKEFFSAEQIQTGLYSIDDFDDDVLSYETLIIGASIRYGKHNEKVFDFIQHNREALKEVKTAFFSVNLVARKKDKNLASTNPYLIKFLKEIDWTPDFLDVFAGKLDYKAYPFFDRIMIKLIMKMTGGPTKTGKPIQYTDWSRVDDFGLKIVKSHNN